MKKLSKHHPVQQKYKESIQNKQELNKYVKGWLLFIAIAVLLVTISWFFGGTFMPYLKM